MKRYSNLGWITHSRKADLLHGMSRVVALNVTCGNGTIPSLSGDERTHRDYRQSVARDPKRSSARHTIPVQPVHFGGRI
jgi:hypothetical protein